MLPLASPLARYAVAVAATALAVAFRGALTPLWGQHLPLIMFYPAIMVSAWLGGFGPGILATTLSAASAALLWPLRMGDNMADLVGLLVFVGIGLFISTLTRALHVTRERLAAIVQIGRSITIIIPADRLDEETQVLTAIRRGKSIEHFDTIRVRKDGRQIPSSLTVCPVRNSAGEIIGVSKISRGTSSRILSAPSATPSTFSSGRGVRTMPRRPRARSSPGRRGIW